jgi:hypothetical protein
LPAALAIILRFMVRTLEAAGISTSGFSGMAKVEGLAGVVLWTLRTFLADDTADLSRTMVAVDKSLSRAETLASLRWSRAFSTPVAAPTAVPPAPSAEGGP